MSTISASSSSDKPLDRFVFHAVAIEKHLFNISPKYGVRYNIPRNNNIRKVLQEQIAMRPSNLIPGLIAIVAKVKIAPNTITGYGEGFFIPKTVYDNDIKLFINTAIDINSKIHKLESLEDYIFIGSPHSSPSLINDYRNTGKEPNVKMYLNALYLQEWENKGGWNNSSNVMDYRLIEYRTISSISPGEELLLDSGEDYWNYNQLCCFKCFKVAEDNDSNPILTCNGIKKLKNNAGNISEYNCLTKYHRNCLDHHESYSETWLCSDCIKCSRPIQKEVKPVKALDPDYRLKNGTMKINLIPHIRCNNVESMMDIADKIRHHNQNPAQGRSNIINWSYFKGLSQSDQAAIHEALQNNHGKALIEEINKVGNIIADEMLALQLSMEEAESLEKELAQQFYLTYPNFKLNEYHPIDNKASESLQSEKKYDDVEMGEANNNQSSLRRFNRSDSNLVPNNEFYELLKPNSTTTKQLFNAARIKHFGLEKRFINNVMGYGVYCKNIIVKSSIVAIFDGEELTHVEAKIKEEEHATAGRGSYMLWLPVVTIQPANSNRKQISAIDPTIIDETGMNWGLARWFNDAPNKSNSITERVANLKLHCRVSEDHQHLFVTMIAVRDIQPEEELLFDYGVENLSWRNKNGVNNPSEQQVNTNAVADNISSTTNDTTNNNINNNNTGNNIKLGASEETFLKVVNRQRSMSDEEKAIELEINNINNIRYNTRLRCESNGKVKLVNYKEDDERMSNDDDDDIKICDNNINRSNSSSTSDTVDAMKNKKQRPGRGNGRSGRGNRFHDEVEQKLRERSLKHCMAYVLKVITLEAELEQPLLGEYKAKSEDKDYYGETDKKKLCHTWCGLNAFRLDYDRIKTCPSCPQNKDNCNLLGSKLNDVVFMYYERLRIRSCYPDKKGSISPQQLMLDAIHSYLDKQNQEQIETRAESKMLDEEKNVVSDENSSSNDNIKVPNPGSVRCSYYGCDVCLNCYSSIYGLGHGTVYNRLAEAVKQGIRIYEHGNKDPIKLEKVQSERLRIGRELLRDLIDDYGQIDPSESAGIDKTAEIIHMPDSNIQELLKRLKEYAHKEGYGYIADVIMSSATLKSIIQNEYNYEGSGRRIVLRKWKNIATCDTCNKLKNSINSARSKAEKKIYKKEYREHLQLAQEQREKYADHIRKAQRSPGEYWVISFDGMDQAKTQLPHISKKHNSKSIDSGPKLNFHVRGIFCFGCNIPCATYIVSALHQNDSNLSVTILHDFIRKCIESPPIIVVQHRGVPIPDNSNPILPTVNKHKINQAVDWTYLKGLSQSDQAAIHEALETRHGIALIEEINKVRAGIIADQATRLNKEQVETLKNQLKEKFYAEYPDIRNNSNNNNTNDNNDSTMELDENKSDNIKEVPKVSCTKDDFIPINRNVQASYCSYCQPSINSEGKLIEGGYCPSIEYTGRLPRKLYIQLDNAAKDNKNKNLYIYCALLVGLGLVESVKLGFEIVGHTHDRIDQLFSRYSVALNHSNAITSKQLMKLLHLAYTVQFQDGSTNKIPSSLQASSVLRRMVIDSANPMIAEVDKVALFRQFIEADLQLTDALKALEGISNAHIFKICLDSAGSWVMIYGREYSKSLNNTMIKIKNNDDSNNDNNSNRGMYQPGVKLFHTSIAEKSLKYDPHYKPLEAVNFKQILHTVDLCFDLKYGTLADIVEWRNIAEAYEKIKSYCNICSTHIDAIGKITIPSKGKISTEQDKTQYRRQVEAKSYARKQLIDHVKVVHEKDRFHGFWSKILCEATFGPHKNSAAAIRRVKNMMKNMEEEEKHGITIDTDKKEKLLLFSNSRAKYDWGAVIVAGMIVAIEFNGYYYPQLPGGISIAIVKNVRPDPDNEHNCYLDITYFDPMPETRYADRYINSLKLCYQNQYNQLKSQLLKKSGNISESELETTILDKLSKDAQEYFKKISKTKAAKKDPTQDKFDAPNNKRQKSSKLNNNDNSEDIIDSSDNNNNTLVNIDESKAMLDIAQDNNQKNRNNDNKSCKQRHKTKNPDMLYMPRGANEEPVAFELGVMGQKWWKLGIVPNYKLIANDQYEYVVYQTDHKGENIPNTHIVGYEKQYDNSESREIPFLPGPCFCKPDNNDINLNISTIKKTNNKRKSGNKAKPSADDPNRGVTADPTIQWVVEYEEIEKASCVAWVPINEAFTGKDLEINPITGWPKKVQNLQLKDKFIQLIRQNIEERKQDELETNSNNNNNSTTADINMTIEE